MSNVSIEPLVSRLERVAEGAQPTPSLKVMARDAAALIRQLAEAKAEEPTGAKEDSKPAPRRGRRPRAEVVEEAPPADA